MKKDDELQRWIESSDFWRNRANEFEVALRKIVSAHNHDRDELASERWEIAHNALEEAKGSKQ